MFRAKTVGILSVGLRTNFAKNHTMFMIDRALDVVHRSIRHTASFEHIQPFFGAFGLEFIFDDPIKCISVFDS